MAGVAELGRVVSDGGRCWLLLAWRRAEGCRGRPTGWWKIRRPKQLGGQRAGTGRKGGEAAERTDVRGGGVAELIGVD